MNIYPRADRNTPTTVLRRWVLANPQVNIDQARVHLLEWFPGITREQIQKVWNLVTAKEA